MRNARTRILALLFVSFFGTSCVPPSCFDEAYGWSASKELDLVHLTMYWKPIPDATGLSMWQRYERGAAITIHQNGRMVVSTLNFSPQQCPTVPQGDLLEVRRVWEPVVEKWEPTLRKMAENSPYRGLNPWMKQGSIWRLAKPFDGMETWVAYGPWIELALGLPSDRTLKLVWDGTTPLPPELEAPVMSTLEMACSNSPLARKYLLAGLPPQVSSRLECQKTGQSRPNATAIP